MLERVKKVRNNFLYFFDFEEGEGGEWEKVGTGMEEVQTIPITPT